MFNNFRGIPRSVCASLVFYLFFASAGRSIAGAPWTEEALIRQYRQTSPLRKSMEAIRLQRSLDATLDGEKFAPRLFASGGRARSSEDPVSPFQPPCRQSIVFKWARSKS